jgi:hypothetical protein
MVDPLSQSVTPKSEPKLRHEFVGMMFAVTIAEVGIQTAGLVQAGNWVHFLPAYGHLVLATVVIATSWVGWTLSVAPGARRDVEKIFQWEFLVLVLDVSLVIVYFIVVRSVDFAERNSPRVAPASTVAAWILAIFCLYLLWDVLTKIIIYWKYRDKSEKSLRRHYGSSWWRNQGARMVPTLVCVILAWVIRRQVGGADSPHRLTADFALLSLVLLFRALKEFISAWIPREPQAHSEGFLKRTKWPLLWTLACVVGMAIGILWTRNWPLPDRITKTIRADMPTETRHSEDLRTTQQPEHPRIDKE